MSLGTVKKNRTQCEGNILCAREVPVNLTPGSVQRDSMNWKYNIGGGVVTEKVCTWTLTLSKVSFYPRETYFDFL